MAFDDLTQFLQAAADASELERVEIYLEADQEIAAVTQEICREFGTLAPVILIENVGNSEIPVVTNLLGNSNRFLRSLGCSHLTEVIDRLKLVLNPFPTGSRDWKFPVISNPTFDRGRFLPRVIRRANCQQVVKLGPELDLGELPQLHCWAGESHAALTGGILVSQGLEETVEIDQLSVALLDRDLIGVHGIPRSSFSRKLPADASVPVAIVFGGDPLLSYVAQLPLPKQLNPWTFAGILRNEGVNLVRCRTVELDVPADAEFILEGYLEPSFQTGEVTLAKSDGVLHTQSDLVAVRITAITHRANPLLPATIPGFDNQESQVTGALTEMILCQAARFLNPAILDLHLSASGNQQHTVVFTTNSTDAVQLQRQFQAICSLPFLDHAETVVALRPEIDLRDPAAVAKEIFYSLGQGKNKLTQQELGERTLSWINATGSVEDSLRCRATAETLETIAQRLSGASGHQKTSSPQSP